MSKKINFYLTATDETGRLSHVSITSMELTNEYLEKRKTHSKEKTEKDLEAIVEIIKIGINYHTVGKLLDKQLKDREITTQTVYAMDILEHLEREAKEYGK